MPRLTHWAAVSCIATLAACTGEIDDQPRGYGPGGGPGLPGVGGTGGAGNDGMVQDMDEAMRAADPVLFDVASKYFPGTSAHGGKKRLFRLTRAQLDKTTQALLPNAYVETVSATMPRDPLQTNYEYSENLSWNAANLTPYAAWVEAIAGRAKDQPGSVIDCTSEADQACLVRASDAFVTRAFRGITTPEQLARFSSFFSASVAEHGLSIATADLVDLTLTSPSYLFREEVATDGASTLLPAQQLQHLTYALADVPPETLQLGGAVAIDAATIEAVLASPLAREKLLKFFVAWLEIREPADFGLAANVFPEWTEEVAAVAVADSTAFVARELANAAPTLKALTHATEAFVSPETAFLYDASTTTSQTPIALEPAERIGIFSQPAVIASHSGPTTTRLVKRGVFFTRKIMCMPLGAPPDGVDTTVPTTPGATERERIESITTMLPCAGCHAFINPFGFMQESYDAIGRFRTRDESDLAIDPSIAIDFLDEGPLSTQTSVEALRALTSSARFKQCFARQVFRYYMGRDETDGDDPVLRQMFFAFAKDDGQDILALLRVLAGSPSFSQRTEAP
jgi:hypothetical protein